MENPKILIASPVRQKPTILDEFLRSLAELDTSGMTISYLFANDNDEEEADYLLERFAQENERTIVRKTDGPVTEFVRNEHTHYWKNDLVWKVASMKDDMIEQAITDSFDYLFLIDSDLVVHPKTLQQLISAGKDIVSNIFWTKWHPDSEELPQVWLKDSYTLHEQRHGEKLSDEETNRRKMEFLQLLRQPGTYEVGGLGACTLISRTAMEAGVRFAKIKNLSFWGEDRHFCIRAAALGFPLYVDTHYPAYHIYRESDLQGVAEYKRQYGADGSKDNKVTVSLCMIVRDEEDVLERCLSSIEGIVDEIIIVDTGSTDRTKEIARKFTDKIYDFEWIDDFAAARNYAFSKADKDYILWLDADDYFTDEDRQLLCETIQTLDRSVDSVTMPYHVFVDEKQKAVHSIRRNRLVRRACGFRWIGAVHEYLEVYGNIIHSDTAVKHNKVKSYTDRNLRIYRKLEAAGAAFSPRDMYYFANELKDNQLYEEAVVYYEKFLATGMGWIEDKINACIKLALCYSRLHEKSKALLALFRTMEYDKPRAEACCRIGSMFFEVNMTEISIYWYELALTLTRPEDPLAMLESEAWTWLPHLQLCMCYFRLGDHEKANEHNEIALSYHPTHPSMIHNKQFFRNLLARETQPAI